MQVLFESRLDLVHGSRKGATYFIQQQPTIHPEPVYKGGGPIDGAGASVSTVLYDGGRFRMWYGAWPKTWTGADTSLTAYAESDDGLHWRRPTLNIRKYGDESNNLVSLGCGPLFIDPNAPPSHRYRATPYLSSHLLGAEHDFRRGYYTSHSADGLHWQVDRDTPAWPGGDAISCVYHPARGCGVVAFKWFAHLSNIARRSIMMAELRDGQLGEPTLALMPDDYDDVTAKARGFGSSDYYCISMLPAGHGTVGFLSQFRHWLPYSGRYWGDRGTTDISLVYQQNPGDRWLHSPGRPDFVSHRSVPFGVGGLYVTPAPLEVGDEHWLYFTGAPHSHSWTGQAMDPQQRKQQMREEGIAQVGLARWRKWRLFGCRSDPDGTISIRLGPITQPSEVVLNYETETDGFVKAELTRMTDFYSPSEPLPGYAFADSVPLAGDSLAETVAWQGGSVIQPSRGESLMLHLHLDRATVWAFDLVA